MEGSVCKGLEGMGKPGNNYNGLYRDYHNQRPDASRSQCVVSGHKGGGLVV